MLILASKIIAMKKVIFTSIILLLFATSVKSQVRIKMQKEGGVYTTPCTINGLRLRFIFDTGASTVSISLSEANFMLKNGYMDESDLHGSSYSQIANGDIVENTTVILRELEIGGIIIRNVEAAIMHELSAPLLLGQSAIEKLGRIQIEDDNLIIFNFNSPSTENACVKAKEMVDKAQQYYFDGLKNLSADTYQNAYDLCPDALDCFSLYLMGSAYYSSNNYSSAITFLKKASNCETKNKTLYYIYIKLADAYRELGDYENAILNTQRALTYAKENKYISSCYFYLGFINSDLKNYYKAVEYYEKSVDYYLKHLSTNVNEVMKGKVKNAMLGESYWNIAFQYHKLGQETKSDNFAIKSALCGYESAIDRCKKFGIRYELYIE